MTLHEKILNIMQNVEHLSKDDNVAFGNTRYKALSEEKVTSIMRKQLTENEIVVYPVEQSSSRTGNITHVDVKYRMVNVEDPMDYIEIVSCGDGADTQDKGSGKAMTYAYKYMWLRTFAIATGEDPDKIASAQLDAEQAAEAQKTEKITKIQGDTLKGLLKGKDVNQFFADYEIGKLSELTREQYAKACIEIDKGKYAQAD